MPGSAAFLLALLATVFPAQHGPAALARAWLPMTIGDRWIYDCEILGDNADDPRVMRWRQQETITWIKEISDGLLIKRKIDYLNNTHPPTYLGNLSEANILVRNNCAYYLDSFHSRYGWDNSKNELTPEFRRDLETNQALPDVCFPLYTGATWGDPSIGRDLWIVAGQGAAHPDDPASVTPQSWRLEAHLASGDDNYVWFRKGVGIVAERTYHNGTYFDYRVRLVRFRPA